MLPQVAGRWYFKGSASCDDQGRHFCLELSALVLISGLRALVAFYDHIAVS